MTIEEQIRAHRDRLQGMFPGADVQLAVGTSTTGPGILWNIQVKIHHACEKCADCKGHSEEFKVFLMPTFDAALAEIVAQAGMSS